MNFSVGMECVVYGRGDLLKMKRWSLKRSLTLQEPLKLAAGVPKSSVLGAPASKLAGNAVLRGKNHVRMASSVHSIA